MTPVFQLLRCIFHAVSNSEKLRKTDNKNPQNEGQQSIFRETYRAQTNEDLYNKCDLSFSELKVKKMNFPT